MADDARVTVEDVLVLSRGSRRMLMLALIEAMSTDDLSELLREGCGEARLLELRRLLIRNS